MSDTDNNLLNHQGAVADSGESNPVAYVPKGNKKPLSKERLEQLAKARQKAIISRKANAEVKRKERELETMRKQQAKQKITDDYARAKAPKEIREKKVAIAEPCIQEDPEAQESDDEEIEYRRKPKKIKKKRIVYVSDDEAEEDEIAPPFKKPGRRVMPMGTVGKPDTLTRTKSLYTDVGW